MPRLGLRWTLFCSCASGSALVISQSPEPCWVLLGQVSGVHFGGPDIHHGALATDAQLARILLGCSRDALLMSFFVLAIPHSVQSDVGLSWRPRGHLSCASLLGRVLGLLHQQGIRGLVLGIVPVCEMQDHQAVLTVLRSLLVPRRSQDVPLKAEGTVEGLLEFDLGHVDLVSGLDRLGARDVSFIC